MVTKPTRTTADGKGYDNAVAFSKVFDSTSDLDHLSHRLMTDDVAFLHAGHNAIVEVKIRPADGGSRNLDYCVCWSWSSGFGTSSTRTSASPCHRRALIGFSPLYRAWTVCSRDWTDNLYHEANSSLQPSQAISGLQYD